ncbi:MAG: phosphoribosylglycinamide formyltransferase [Gaiella sp.]
MSAKLGVLASGAGSNLQALLDDGLPVVAVASDVPGARALERARERGIPTAAFPAVSPHDRTARDAALARFFLGHGVTHVVCAGYMQILRPSFLDRFPGRVLNVHPALLPAFPGARAVEDALAAGVATTGATVHVVDEGVDTGPVLRQAEVPVHPGDTPETLRARIRDVEHRLLPAAVREVIAV